MNTQTFFQTNKTNRKTNFVKRALFGAVVVGMMLATAPAASASVASCGLNPASQGWVPLQVTMEYEAR